MDLPVHGVDKEDKLSKIIPKDATTNPKSITYGEAKLPLASLTDLTHNINIKKNSHHICLKNFERYETSPAVNTLNSNVILDEIAKIERSKSSVETCLIWEQKPKYVSHNNIGHLRSNLRVSQSPKPKINNQNEVTINFNPLCTNNSQKSNDIIIIANNNKEKEQMDDVVKNDDQDNIDDIDVISSNITALSLINNEDDLSFRCCVGTPQKPICIVNNYNEQLQIALFSLNLLNSEVLKNGFGNDLKNEISYPEIIKKMNHKKHIDMGKPLNMAHMAALMLYCNGKCSNDFSASQRDNNYEKWSILDNLLCQGTEKLSKYQDINNWVVYSGICDKSFKKENKMNVTKISLLTFHSFSKEKITAKRFRGAKGMLIGAILNNSVIAADISWISNYKESEVLVSRLTNSFFVKILLNDKSGNQLIEFEFNQNNNENNISNNKLFDISFDNSLPEIDNDDKKETLIAQEGEIEDFADRSDTVSEISIESSKDDNNNGSVTIMGLAGLERNNNNSGGVTIMGLAGLEHNNNNINNNMNNNNNENENGNENVSRLIDLGQSLVDLEHSNINNNSINGNQNVTKLIDFAQSIADLAHSNIHNNGNNGNSGNNGNENVNKLIDQEPLKN